MKLSATHLIDMGKRAPDNNPVIAETTEWATSVFGDHDFSETPLLSIAGSVANRTNVDLSDIDISMKLPPQYDPDNTFVRWGNLRDELTQALHHTGHDYTTENKCLRVRRMGATVLDVLPCIETTDGDMRAVEFWAKDDRGSLHHVRSFPSAHVRNTDAKDERTGGAYREVIRAVKHARAALIKEAMIRPEDAPAYFLECLLYNVPDAVFDDLDSATLRKVILTELRDAGHHNNPVTVNERDVVFGDTLWQWNLEDKDRFIARLLDDMTP